MRKAAVIPTVVVACLLSAPAWGQTRAGSEFQVNTYTTNDQRSASVASDTNGNFVVVWTSNGPQDGSNNGVFGQRFSSGGAALGTEFQVNTYTTGSQASPKVASDMNGNFAVVWESQGQDGDQNGIFGKRFSSSGAALGTEFQVNTYTTSYQNSPQIASDAAGDFVVVWASYQDGYYTGVFGRRFSSSGAPLGTEFQINTYTTSYQLGASVASDQAGDFVVVWSSRYQDGYYDGVFGQRFSSSGARLGTEFQVNTYTSGYQSSASVASDMNGDFVVVWQSGNDQDGSNYGIFGQRFSSNGALLGTEFQVNAYTTSGQFSPRVASDLNGNFVVVWQSDNNQDGSGYGVFGRRFSSSGSPLGSEFQVNSYTSGLQVFPAITSDGHGDFVVAWQSALQDGSAYGVFAQRFQGFDVCLQDDKTKSVLQFNSASGDYQFCCKPPGQPPAPTLSGTGSISVNGCFTHLTSSSGGRIVSGELNTCTKRGSASLKTRNSRFQCSVNDGNTTNNTCTCP